MGVMMYDVLKNNFKTKYRPSLKENFSNLLIGLEGFTKTSNSVEVKYGPLNFSKLDYTIPNALIPTLPKEPSPSELEAIR